MRTAYPSFVLVPTVAMVVLWCSCTRETDPATSRTSSRVTERWLQLEVRPMRGRLAGLVPYRPYRQLRDHAVSEDEFSGGTRGTALDKPDERRLRRKAERARLNLLAGRGGCAPASDLRALSESAVGRSRWEAWNDLGVALFDCAPDESTPGKALKQALLAFEAIGQSLALNDSPAVTHFNRALILETLPLFHRSRDAWDRYITEIDGDSPWAAEARTRRSDLAAGKQVSHGLIATRDRIETALLPHWAAEVARSGAAETPSLPDALASSLDGLRDAAALSTKSAEVIQRTAALPESAQALATAHELFAEGIALYREEQVDEAEAAFENAYRRFRQAGSPMALRARLRRLWTGRGELEEIEAVLQAATAGGFRWAAADATRLLAWYESRAGGYLRAVDLYREAEERFREVGAEEEAAVASIMGGQLLMDVNRPERGLVALARGLREVPRMDDPWNRYASLWVSAEAIRAMAPRAATEIQLEALRACDDLTERPLCGPDLLIAMTRADLSIAQTKEFLDQAERRLAHIEPRVGKDRTEVDLRLARARNRLRSSRPDDASEAIDLMTPALAYYEHEELDVALARARMLQATALEVLDRDSEARSTLHMALGHVRQWDEERRARPVEVRERSPRTLRDIFERLIKLAAAQGDTREPFLLSEEMRHRLAPTAAPLRAPLEWQDIEAMRRTIPPGAAVVEYAVMTPTRSHAGPTALAWIVTKEHFEMVELDGGSDLGDRLVLLQHFEAVEDLARWREVSADLWSQWMGPIMGRLPHGTERLYVIPDSELFALPFRALLDQKLNVYVDESLTLAIGPSLHELANSPPGGGIATPKVLSLGFDSFDGRHADLAHAEEEARRVAATYPGEAELECAGRTWSALRACLPQATVIHLVTHARAGKGLDGRSWLALRRADIDIRRLWRELPVLPRAEVVVLAACESVASADGGEGLGGLARPFLARGAKTVVGTLRPIEDAAALEFFPRFHRAYSVSGDAAAALRAARERVPEWDQRPWEWGNVQAIVGRW